MSMLWIACLLLAPAAVPEGDAKIEVNLDGTTLNVYTHRPAAYRDGSLLIVFHGVGRDAEVYRNDARAMADRFGMLVATPEFDKARFGVGMYQQGGLKQGGKVVPASQWTWSLIPKLIAALRAREGRADLPVYLIGHSAGGQFTMRLTAFVETGAARLVAANPGSDLFPTKDRPYPYGFGGLPDELSDDDFLRRYLARPFTLYMGTGDTERTDDLDRSDEADREGLNRYQRARNAFQYAEELARRKGWPFGWRYVEAPGIGHDHQAMFDAPACAIALFGKDKDEPQRHKDTKEDTKE